MMKLHVCLYQSSLRLITRHDIRTFWRTWMLQTHYIVNTLGMTSSYIHKAYTANNKLCRKSWWLAWQLASHVITSWLVKHSRFSSLQSLWSWSDFNLTYVGQIKVKHKNRKTKKKQRKPEWMDVCRFVCIVILILKYYYANEAAGIYLLRCS